MNDRESSVAYSDLLQLAVANGLQELDCTVIQLPSEQNRNHAVVLATVRSSRGSFHAIGEAHAESLPLAYQGIALTVAELLAKTRALGESIGRPQPLSAILGLAGIEAAIPTLEGVEGAQPMQGTFERVRDEFLAAPTPDPYRSVPPTQAPAEEVLSGAQSDDVPPLGLSEPRFRRSSTTADMTPAAVVSETITQIPGTSAPAGSTSVSRAAVEPASLSIPSEDLGPDVLARLLHMTRKKAESEGADITEEEAMRRLDSFFQRAFGHPLSEGTRMEGQRVVQRLASELARLSMAGNQVRKAGS
jgi:hypothetical protein